MSDYWCSAVRLLDQFTFPVRQLAPEHYLMKRIIQMDYSDLTQLWTFCYSREDTYIKIIAAILDSASHLERLIQKIEWHFLRCPAIGAFTLLCHFREYNRTEKRFVRKTEEIMRFYVSWDAKSRSNLRIAPSPQVF